MVGNVGDVFRVLLDSQRFGIVSDLVLIAVVFHTFRCPFGPVGRPRAKKRNQSDGGGSTSVAGTIYNCRSGRGDLHHGRDTTTRLGLSTESTEEGEVSSSATIGLFVCLFDGRARHTKMIMAVVMMMVVIDIWQAQAAKLVYIHKNERKRKETKQRNRNLD